MKRDDGVIVDAIGTALEATGLFSAVVVGATPGEYPVGADRATVAWIKRVSWVETKASNEQITDRDVSFYLWVSVRNPDTLSGWRTLNKIESAVANALNRKSLGGYTQPMFTNVVRGDDQPAPDNREQIVRITGTFRYQLDDDGTDHDTTDV